jgi:hypothetical protein
MKHFFFFGLILIFAGRLFADPFHDSIPRWPHAINYFSPRLGIGGFKSLNGEIGFCFVSAHSLIRYGSVSADLTAEFNQFNRHTLWGPKLSICAANTFRHKSNYEAGGNLCFILYSKNGNLSPAVRPEVVISFLGLFDLAYGYNFYLGNRPDGIYNTHVISLIIRPAILFDIYRGN